MRATVLLFLFLLLGIESSQADGGGAMGRVDRHPQPSGAATIAQQFNCPGGSVPVYPTPSTIMCQCPDGSYAGLSGCPSALQEDQPNTCMDSNANPDKRIAACSEQIANPLGFRWTCNHFVQGQLQTKPCDERGVSGIRGLLYNSRGLAYRAKGDLRSAITDFQKAVASARFAGENRPNFERNLKEAQFQSDLDREYDVADFTVATSSFYSTGGINLAGGCFAYQGNCLNNLSLSAPNIWTGLQTFANGFLSQASSTIGNGNQNGGLTVNGGATTTGVFTINSPTATSFNITAPTGGASVTANALNSANLTLSAPFNNSSFTINSGSSGLSAINLNQSSTNYGSLTLNGSGHSVSLSSFSAAPLAISAGGANLTLVGGSGNNLIFQTNGGTEAARFTSGGLFGIGTTSPGSIFSIAGVGNWTAATSTYYSSGGINLAAGCFSINGTCITSGGGSVTSITAGTGLTGGTITTSGTIALDLTRANSWTGLQQLSSASSSLFSAYGPAYFGATATSSFGTNGSLTLAGLETQQAGFVSQASSTIGNGTQAGGLTIAGGATTTGVFTINSPTATSFNITAPTGGASVTANALNTANMTLNAGFSTVSLNMNSGNNNNVAINLQQSGANYASFGLDASHNASLKSLNSNPLTVSSHNTDLTLSGGTSHGVIFQTNGSTEAARFTSAGLLGIGTTSPAYKLTVDNSGSAGTVAGFENSSGECTINPTSSSVNCSSDITLKKDINPISTSSALANLLDLNPVYFNWNAEATGTPQHSGFVAQQVQPIFPDLVSQADNGTLLLNYAGFAPYIVKSIQDIASIGDQFAQNLTTWLGSASNGIVDLFAQNIRAENELCVGSTCVTPAQFQAMAAAASSAQPSGQASGTQSSSATSSGASSAQSDPPPIIQINGDNPAIIQVGDAYADLGATIIGPQADLNLGVRLFLDGAAVNAIQFDTSAAATDTIDYVVTDSQGMTSTSSRTVIVQAGSLNPPTTVIGTSTVSTGP